jgi:hypothetical protein
MSFKTKEVSIHIFFHLLLAHFLLRMKYHILWKAAKVFQEAQILQKRRNHYAKLEKQKLLVSGETVDRIVIIMATFFFIFSILFAVVFYKFTRLQ